jgi:23S rRNA (adenine-N6)-dimethyltransferase
MRHRSLHGGRHELGQNFLTHGPTIHRIVGLVAATSGPILELGAGDGALTIPLAHLGRDLAAIDIDEHRVRSLRRRLPRVRIEHGDALRHPLDRPVVVGNVPYHLTTPILRRMLARSGWHDAVLLTQWEVARKRAGVGGGTMMSAQAAPWFAFSLDGRVPARHFRPMPSVDGGVLRITRRPAPLIEQRHRPSYDRFVRAMFTGRGSGLAGIVRDAAGVSRGRARAVLAEVGARDSMLPRDLRPEQWAALWRGVAV